MAVQINSQEARDVVERLKRMKGVVAVILFGSVARGKSKPMSDVDIAVVIDRKDPALEVNTGSMYSDKLDVVLFHRLPLHIQYEVLRHGRVLYVRDDKKFREVIRRVMRSYLDTRWLYERMRKRVLAR